MPKSRERRRERLYAEYMEAANDPDFAAEMLELDSDFDVTIADGLSDEQAS